MPRALRYRVRNVGVADLIEDRLPIPIQPIDGTALHPETLRRPKRQSDEPFVHALRVQINQTASTCTEVPWSIEATEAERAVPNDGDTRIKRIAWEEFLEQNVPAVSLEAVVGNR